MNDAGFHLTPNDVRGQQFTRTMRGYDRFEVESFRDRVADELDRLLRERLQTEERMRNAQEQLRAFRERERALNDALIAAQQLRAEAKQAADRESDMVVREARAEGERLVERARGDERLVRERAETAARQFSTYVAAFRALLERQMAELDVLEGHAKTIVQVQTEALTASLADEAGNGIR
jgi:DivIVA domain-containing protein